MVVTLLREARDHTLRPRHKGDVIGDLEFSMRAKGGLSREQEITLRVMGFVPQAGFIVGAGFSSYLGWFGLNLGRKFVGLPPIHGLQRFGFAAGLAYLMGKAMYLSSVKGCASVILKSEDEYMKMELANIILTKHSDDEPLVRIVKRHFFSEHLFDDLHQDKPLFRWHPRHSYVDSAFVERMKEIEASDSYDEASISRETTLNTRSFGDLADDPFACILGSPGGSMVSNRPPEKAGTVLKRSELRARRRIHRHHHHPHADKLTAL